MAQLSQADKRFYARQDGPFVDVEAIWNDPMLYLDGGLDEAEEERPGLLQEIINLFTWRIAIGMGGPEHHDFLAHAERVKADMARIAAEDGQ